MRPAVASQSVTPPGLTNYGPYLNFVAVPPAHSNAASGKGDSGSRLFPMGPREEPARDFHIDSLAALVRPSTETIRRTNGSPGRWENPGPDKYPITTTAARNGRSANSVKQGG